MDVANNNPQIIRMTWHAHQQQTDFALKRIAHLLPLLELDSAHPGLEQAPQEMGLFKRE